MLLWAVRAAFFYLPQHRFVVSSCYRCSLDNRQHGRSSTNHHGKAIDLDIPLKAGESKRDDMLKCDAIRGRLVETAHAQVGWDAANRKALEPSHIAPTWVHYDVRCYEPKYLGDEMFCTTLKQLDSNVPGPIATSAVIQIPQGDRPAVQVVLDRVEHSLDVLDRLGRTLRVGRDLEVAAVLDMHFDDRTGGQISRLRP